MSNDAGASGYRMVIMFFFYMHACRWGDTKPKNADAEHGQHKTIYLTTKIMPNGTHYPWPDCEFVFFFVSLFVLFCLFCLPH